MDAEGGTRGRHLADPCSPGAGITEQLLLEDLRTDATDVLRSVLSLPSQRTRQLRVERSKRALHAAERIGFRDRRVVDGRIGRRIGEQRDGWLTGLRARAAETLEAATETAEDLAILHGGADRLLQRQLPDLVEVGIGERQRLARAGGLIERLVDRIGILDLLDGAHIVGEVAVLEEVKWLSRSASARHEHDARHGHPDSTQHRMHGGGFRRFGSTVPKVPPPRPRGPIAVSGDRSRRSAPRRCVRLACTWAQRRQECYRPCNR